MIQYPQFILASFIWIILFAVPMIHVAIVCHQTVYEVIHFLMDHFLFQLLFNLNKQQIDCN